MAQKIHQKNKKKSAKPSRLSALIALVIALSLPYLLVKTFSNHSTTHDNNTLIALPKLKPNKPKKHKASSTEEDWTIVTTKPGDTLSAVFPRVGLNAKQLQALMANNPYNKTLKALKPNQKLQFLIRKNTLKKLILPINNTQFLVIYKKGDQYRTKVNSRKMNIHNHYVTATIQGSLYGTARKLHIPFKLIHQMTEILNWEIDFARDVRTGDQFTILYKAYYLDDKLVGTGEIVAVSYTNRGKKHQAIRHTNAAHETDYFSPQGNSFKKAFSRYPLRFSHISSTFSLSRFHPRLHYNRPHKGVDLAARIGTPIMATGNGTIVVIGRQSGYGNMIKIRHDNQFSSIYGHMLKFQKGLSRGSKVKRGQVIGFVGQTGLATGPHCHYEFHIKNQPKNPTTIVLPRSAPIPAREMASFKANSATLLAHLKLFEEASLANKGHSQAEVG
jgi:murein DD-endopeptidase MepM/ murein hydrolase activator NlpD